MNLTIPVPDGAFAAYAEVPKKLPAAGIVVLSPVFGVDQDMRGFVRRYAERGYLAVAPDLFWRVLPGPLRRSGEDYAKALERKARVDVQKVRSDVAAAIAFVRAMPQCNGALFAIGFCFGGRYAMRAALNGLVEAAGAFHASEVGLELPDLPKLRVPVSFHYGDSDSTVPMSEVNAIRAALQTKEGSEICVYPGARHSFSIPGNAAYDARAAEISQERVFALFDRLRSSSHANA